jgi:uncharacterized protein (TIGR00730 family)
MLIKFADACIFFPGGFGTADELMEILTLVQTRKGKQIKIFLFGEVFWTPLLTWFDDLKKNRYIDKADLETFTIVNSVEQILTILEAK